MIKHVCILIVSISLLLHSGCQVEERVVAPRGSKASAEMMRQFEAALRREEAKRASAQLRQFESELREKAALNVDSPPTLRDEAPPPNDSEWDVLLIGMDPKSNAYRPSSVREEASSVPSTVEQRPYESGRISAAWALVIGLSEYANSGNHGLSNLAYADDDAKAFVHSLRQQGWSSSHIKLLTNEQATQRNIMIAMESWLTKAGRDDMIVLFWSGHGFPDPEDPEKVYFACYDTDIRIPATG